VQQTGQVDDDEWRQKMRMSPAEIQSDDVSDSLPATAADGGEQVAISCRRETARRLKSVEILSAAAQLYEKSHLTRRTAI